MLRQIINTSARRHYNLVSSSLVKAARRARRAKYLISKKNKDNVQLTPVSSLPPAPQPSSDTKTSSLQQIKNKVKKRRQAKTESPNL